MFGNNNNNNTYAQNRRRSPPTTVHDLLPLIMFLCSFVLRSYLVRNDSLYVCLYRAIIDTWCFQMHAIRRSQHLYILYNRTHHESICFFVLRSFRYDIRSSFFINCEMHWPLDTSFYQNPGFMIRTSTVRRSESKNRLHHQAPSPPSTFINHHVTARFAKFAI